MTELEFTFDSRDLKVFADRKIERALFYALKKSGATATRSMKAASNRKVRELKRMKVAAVNEALPTFFPRGSSIDNLVWKMKVSGKPVPMIAFPVRQTRQGVSAAINTGKRTLIKSAFIAVMGSGHRGVFVRTRGQRRRSARGADLPIRELYTTRVSDVFKNAGFVPDVLFRTQTVFHREFSRLLPYELSKLKR